MKYDVVLEDASSLFVFALSVAAFPTIVSQLSMNIQVSSHLAGS